MSLVQSTLRSSKIIPVVVVDDETQGVMVAEALLQGGLHCMEITLRTERAFDAIAAVGARCSGMTVGAGTILHLQQFKESRLAGAQFFVSPGVRAELLAYAKASALPYLPGVSTCSEIMEALEFGFDALKLFPASVVGGVPFLRALKGPFSAVRFCPTGGIDEQNVADYLALDNVFAVGGSWMVPRDMVIRSDWSGIERLARQALAASL